MSCTSTLRGGCVLIQMVSNGILIRIKNCCRKARLSWGIYSVLDASGPKIGWKTQWLLGLERLHKDPGRWGWSGWSGHSFAHAGTISIPDFQIPSGTRELHLLRRIAQDGVADRRHFIPAIATTEHNYQGQPFPLTHHVTIHSSVPTSNTCLTSYIPR